MHEKKIPGSLFRDHFYCAFFASLSVSVSLMLAGLTLYCKNSGEFTFRFTAIALVVLLGTLGVTFFLMLPQLLLWRWKYFSLLNSLILAFGYFLWLQNSYWTEIFPDYVPGISGMDFTICFLWGLNLILCLAPFAVAVLFRRWCNAHCGKLCAIILTAQLIPLFFLLAHYSPPKYDFYEYSIQENDKFKFATRDNVVVVVVDCMSEFLLKKLMKKAPEIGEMFRDFTCFDGIVSGTIPQTIYAVPALLTGMEYSSQENTPWKGDHGEFIKQAYQSEKSLFRNFKEAGYRCEGYPYALQAISYNKEILDNVVVRTTHTQSFRMFTEVFFLKMVPFFMKAVLEDSGLSLKQLFVGPVDEVVVSNGDIPHDLAFYKRLSTEMKLGTYEKGFKYFHLQGAHGPLKINEKLEAALDTNVERQLKGSLRNVELLLKNMKKLGIYDDALIVVTGDHTERYTPEMITLVKRPGEKHPGMLFNSVSCRLSDLPAAILAEKEIMKSPNTLFARPAVSGTGASIRMHALPETVYSDHWRQTGVSPYPETVAYFMITPTSLENDQLSSPRSDIDSNPLLRVWFRAIDLNNGKTWETEPAAVVKGPRLPDLYQTHLKALPDGEYAFFIVEEIGILQENPNGLQEIRKEHRQTALPYFYLIAGGRFDRTKISPRTVPRPMRVGERIQFHPFNLYPSLSFSDDCMPGKDCLSMRESDSVTVQLPSGMIPLFLSLTVHCVVLDKSVFQVYDGETLIHSAKVNSGMSVSVDFLIPDSSRKRKKLQLSFKLIPQYAEPGRKTVSVFHLFEIGLKPAP